MRSTDLPVADRFDWWCACTAEDLVPTRITRRRSNDFPASVRMMRLGQVQVTALEFPALRSVRTDRLIRQSDPELWMLAYISGGALALEQGRRGTSLRTGDLVLYDTSRPFDSLSDVADGLSRTILLHLPRCALPIREQRLRDLTARRMSSDSGPAALLAVFLRGLMDQAAVLTEAHKACVAPAALDLAAACLADAVGAPEKLPAETQQAVLVRAVKRFILSNLADSGLSPAGIAAAHHISVRHLHSLFQRHEDATVAAFIREERLRRSRAELADVRTAGESVQCIGARWGFHDAAVFNRAFKKRYGITPGAYRESLRSN
ncbi:helix-turn-helix domain-containing protein [Streptomyces sp. NPDC046759]|uniref:helix-turn-helix domain-containing protein n=1 Tax=Streptomyces sp. NPDC046759 TaxID=3155019 RepID=UPI0033CE6298